MKTQPVNLYKKRDGHTFAMLEVMLARAIVEYPRDYHLTSAWDIQAVADGLESHGAACSVEGDKITGLVRRDSQVWSFAIVCHQWETPHSRGK